jgi:monoamine oxidase
MADIIVIGAGVAGLATTRVLSQAGLTVDLLEARDRIGGRIYTQHNSIPVELGAEFIHGRPEATFELVRSGGIDVAEMHGNLWVSMGRSLEQASGWGFGDDAIWRALDHWDGDDRTFDQFAAERFPGDEWAEARQMAARYLEGFDAARPDRVSMQWFVKTEAAQAEIDGAHNYRVPIGYDAVPEQIATGFPLNRVALHLNTIVDEIRWSKGLVEVMTHATDSTANPAFTAERTVVTLPLGVLKNGIRFSPNLPDKQAAMQQIEMGAVIKPVLHFRERFWHETMGFLFSDDEWTPTWWTQYPNEVPLLTGWVGGPRAERLSQKGKDFVTDRALDALARIFSMERERLESLLEASYVHDWQADPFSRGAYTYVTVGGIDAPGRLAQPVEDTLFFAGEATDTLGYTGTVHGAIISGQRAAEEVSKSL